MSVIKIIYLLLFIITINCSGNKVSNYHGVKSLEDKFERLIIGKIITIHYFVEFCLKNGDIHDSSQL